MKPVRANLCLTIAGRVMAQSTKVRRSNKERRRDSDERIISAAIELFAQQGYLKTTLIQIGKVAGCTGTLVSNRFHSKEGLLRAVIAHIMSRFEDEERKDKPEKASDKMRDFLELYFKDVAQNEVRIRALHVLIGEALGALPEIQDEITNVYTLFRGDIARFIRYGLQSGEYRDDLDIDQTSILIVGILRGITMQYLADPKTVDLDAMLPVIQKNILKELLKA